MARAATLAAGASSAGCVAASVAYVLTRAPAVRVLYIPDDTFYYLGLARNYVETGTWTFDRGVSVTTGFHLLHGYLLALIYRLWRPGPDAFVSIGVLVGAVALVPAWLVATRFAMRQPGMQTALVLALFGLSPNVLRTAPAGMEWALAVSAAACLAWSWMAAPRRHAVAAMFAIGFLGTLARSDFGLFPAALAIASLFRVAARTPDASADARRAFAALAGAVAGDGVVMLHTFAVTGGVFQSSARMKLLWLGDAWPSPRPIAVRVVALFGPSDLVTWVLVAALAAVVLALGASRILTTFRAGIGAFGRAEALWTASVVTIAGYLVVYAFARFAVQSWYTANLLAPLFIVLALPLGWGTASTRTARLAGCALLAVLIAREAVFVPSSISYVKEHHPRSMYDAGMFLRAHPLDRRVAAWNAGIVGYYSGGRVVNIDGLVNDDIYRYAKRNALADYIRAADIGYIVDARGMTLSEEYRRRGGYDNPAFIASLVPIREFDHRDEVWGHVTLYRVAPSADASGLSDNHR